MADCLSGRGKDMAVAFDANAVSGFNGCAVSGADARFNVSRFKGLRPFLV